MSVRNYVVTFGRHKGETLEEIYISDKDWLEWAYENIDRDNLNQKIEELFEEMKDVKIY